MVAAAKLIEKVGGKVNLFTDISHFGQENFFLENHCIGSVLATYFTK